MMLANKLHPGLLASAPPDPNRSWTPLELGADCYANWDSSVESTLTLTGDTWEWRDKSVYGRHLQLDATAVPPEGLPFTSTESNSGLNCLNIRNYSFNRPSFHYEKIRASAVVMLNNSGFHNIIRMGFNGWIFRQDPDGYIRTYWWDVNGQPRIANPIYIPPNGLEVVGFQIYDVPSFPAIREFINGVEILGFLDGGVSIFDEGPGIFRAGGSPGFNLGEGYNGKLCEIELMNPLLSYQQYYGLDAYLCHKWGLQAKLSPSNPFKNNPPRVSDF